MNFASNEPRLDVFICIPNHYVKKIQISPNQKISALNKLFPNEKKTYIHKGQILSENVTFEDYNFDRSEHVVVLSKTNSENFKFDELKWLQLTRDTETFTEKICTSASRKASREFARLKDIRITKLEQKKSFWTKKCSCFIEQEGSACKNTTPLVTDFKQFDSPCSDAMPILW